MGSKTEDFTARVIRALDDASRYGIRFTAGTGSNDLELQQLAHRFPGEDGEPTGRPHHLESPPGARDPGRADGTSQLCYFLDGVQGSHEIGRIGAAPIVVATVATTVVERKERRLSRMHLGGPPEVVRAVILPRRAGDEVEEFYRLLYEVGLAELGPDEPPHSPEHLLDSTEYATEMEPSDYVRMRERAFVRVRALRERLEGALLRRWEDDDRVLENEGWIAVDGQLKDVRESNRRAIGLIKSVARPEFAGEEVRMLLDLEPGKRTTSFIPDWQLRRAPGERRTSWYMRMWPPQSNADALGSLTRIEAPRDTSPESVDEISRWLMAERAPLAKPDPRWPSMIYPIQHVEKVLQPLLHGNRRDRMRLEREIASLDR